MGVVIAVMARKGGCGKTSLCANLAGHWAAEEQLTVRVVDCDNQANLSQFFLGDEVVENLKADASVEACLAGADPATIERPTGVPGVSIVPARLAFTTDQGFDLNLWGNTADVTLVDTPPDLQNRIIKPIMLTSDFILSPVDPEAFGAASVASVKAAMHGVAMAYNPRLRLLGYVINKRARLKVHATIEDTLRRLEGDTIMKAVIPNRVAFKKAIVARTPITLYDDDDGGDAAESIRNLSTEIFDRIEAISRKVAA